MSFEDTPSVIFSPGSAVGPRDSEEPDGRPTDLFGRDHAPVSHSRSRERGKAKMTPAISGLNFEGSSPSASLQRSLESRLRQKLDVNGSQEYALTWKSWAMQSGPPICALRARAHRTSDKDCSGELVGYPTPRTTDGQGSKAPPNRQWGMSLHSTVELVGWATASSRDWKDTPGMATTGTNPDGSERTRLDQLPRQVGMIPTPSSASTEKPAAYRLNPRFSLWLMGFPAGWASSGARAMRSCRKSRRRSSKR